MRTVPGTEDQLKSLENAIWNKLILELLEERPCNNEERKLLALIPKLSGLDIISPVDIAEIEYMNSKKLIETLTKAVKRQQNLYIENQSAMKNIRTVIRAEKQKQLPTVYNSIKNNTKDQTKMLKSSIESTRCSNHLSNNDLKV